LLEKLTNKIYKKKIIIIIDTDIDALKKGKREGVRGMA
jgi:hypothetical protein